MKPTISIIVPVYNVDNYLDNCLKSIKVQTYKNWECLLIDDGSTDNSGAICEQITEKDKRFRVFHKKNGGVSTARNFGIKEAKGEWITFVDADDMISPSFLGNLLIPVMKDTELDFVHGGCSNWKDGKPSGINQTYEDFIGNDPGIIFDKFRGLIVSKLFRLENIRLWNNGSSLRFDEKMKIAEDMAFTLDYLITVRKYAFVSEIGYYYRMDNTTSATHLIKHDTFENELSGFSHLYKSTFNYIDLFSLDEAISHKRIEQRAVELLTILNLLYDGEFSRTNRITTIKTLMSQYSNILPYINTNHRLYKESVFLAKQQYLKYDIYKRINHYLRYIKHRIFR